MILRTVTGYLFGLSSNSKVETPPRHQLPTWYSYDSRITGQYETINVNVEAPDKPWLNKLLDAVAVTLPGAVIIALGLMAERMLDDYQSLRYEALPKNKIILSWTEIKSGSANHIKTEAVSREFYGKGTPTVTWSADSIRIPDEENLGKEITIFFNKPEKVEFSEDVAERKQKAHPFGASLAITWLMALSIGIIIHDVIEKQDVRNRELWYLQYARYPK